MQTRFASKVSDLEPEGNPKLKYAPKDIKQSLDDCKTKADVIKELAKVPGAGRFYIQHGLILMTRGGSICNAMAQAVLQFASLGHVNF